MRVIFLDVDGVLNTAYTRERIPGLHYIGVDGRRVEVLRTLVDESGKEDETIIVLSSSWRAGIDRFGHEIPGHYQYLRDCLGEQGLTIYDETPFVDGEGSRGAQIRAWLKENKALGITGMVVLDDVCFPDFQSTWISKYWVQTSYWDAKGGLQNAHVRQALKIMHKEIPDFFWKD